MIVITAIVVSSYLFLNSHALFVPNYGLVLITQKHDACTPVVHELLVMQH